MVGGDLQEIDAVAVAEQLGEERLAEAEPDAEHRQVASPWVSLRSRRIRRHSRPAPQPPPPPHPAAAPASARCPCLKNMLRSERGVSAREGHPEDSNHQQAVGMC